MIEKVCGVLLCVATCCFSAAALAECMDKKARTSMCPAGNFTVCQGGQPCHNKNAVPGSLKDGPFSCVSNGGAGKECVTMTVAEAEYALQMSGAGRCVEECVCTSVGGMCGPGQNRWWIMHSPLYTTQDCN